MSHIAHARITSLRSRLPNFLFTAALAASAAFPALALAGTGPVITTQPHYVLLKPGQPAVFSVVATSSTPVTYQWTRNGVALPGATSSSYALPAVALSDNGSSYQVKLINAGGPSWSNYARVTVTANTPGSTTPTTPTTPTPPVPTSTSPTTVATPPPVVTLPPVVVSLPVQPLPAPPPAAPTFTAQPQSLVVNGGQAATFSVGVNSAVPVAYQWSRNGVPLAGSTAPTYTLAATQLADNNAALTVTVTTAAGTLTSAVARLTVNATPTNAATADRPFSDQSPWNSRPTQFTLAPPQVAKAAYLSSVSAGPYSVGVFRALPTDPPMDILPPVGSTAGIWVYDAETNAAKVTIPHWPANVVPATGDDGHADIVDVAANKIHSFYKLRLVNGVWHSATYSWTALDGRGWGNPAQYVQGARAAGVVPMAGLIRSAELNDGAPAYKHALAMSLPVVSLSASPTYVFPATSADNNAAFVNHGGIPEGALLMLPANFDLSRITDPRILKIARTLQSYGAYVVDRNESTGFLIYVEIGSGFKLMPDSGWDMGISGQLELIRAGLQQMTGATEWVDATGAVFSPDHNLNILSMRGRWFAYNGATAGVFDTMQQAVVFPDNGIPVVQVNSTRKGISSVLWATPQAGQQYTLQVHASGGTTFRLDFGPLGSAPLFTTGVLTDGASVTFTWPAGNPQPDVTLTSGPQGGGTISATLVPVQAVTPALTASAAH